jgi:hypothetical protein
MKSSKSKNVVIVTIKDENDKITVENGLGQEWQFPKRMSKRVALSALVYGALLNAQETISAYSSKYRISIEIENLDVEDDGAQ